MSGEPVRQAAAIGDLSSIRLEIAPGQIVTASITNEAVEELGLKSGAAAIAIVKASDVMIAID